MNALRDPLQLPLEGIRVVEASAGTGKTFTIATLYLRLILERGLLPEAIVVATFTRAATAELSERLRARLVCADEMLTHTDSAASRPGESGDAAAARGAIRHASDRGKTLDELRGHIHKARLAMDSAVIGTLHSFCFRALGEFGFETGQALDVPELIDDVRALELEIVRDFWRRGSADARTAHLLAGTWGSPEALAKQVCEVRWRGREIAVPEVDFASLCTDFENARKRIAAWNVQTIQTANDALLACISHPPTLKDRATALAGLHAWAGASEHDEETDSGAVHRAQTLDAKALDKVNPKGLHATGIAFDDLTSLCAAHAAMGRATEDQQKLRAARLLREARACLEAERPRRLAARNLMSHDQAVDRLAAALTDPVRGDAAVVKMRARWKAALIDEFQDTDIAQWQIVRRLFGDTTLVLVGDPKQAIYGFRGGDVFAWREAVAASQHARLELATSHRSGAGMTRAINALFDRPDAFIEQGFDYTEVASDAMVAQRSLLRAGEPVPALQLWRLDSEAIDHTPDKPPSKAKLRIAIQSACVTWIADALDDSTAQLRHGDGRLECLQPKHIAILVNTNAEAGAMQDALGRAGIPASSNLRASVYASDEAVDLALLLDALAAPGDVRRARAAHASVLAGRDAPALAVTNIDAQAQATMLERVAGWAVMVNRHGPLPWLHQLIAEAAPRILTWPDGERRMANYLQLAELLQDLHATSFGTEDLAVRFARARIEADDDADSARLRIDTGTDAVTIATVHAAKGLEYDVVVLPYAVLAQDPSKITGDVPLFWYHAGNKARVALGNGAPAAIRNVAIAEQRAEEVRKFYVAVTRAKALCVLPWGPATSTRFSPVFHLLHEAGRAEALPADATGCRQALDALCERADGAVSIVPLPTPHQTRRHASREDEPQTLAAREFSRDTLERDWQTWSFSRLVRGHAIPTDGDPAPGAGDGDTASADATPARPTLAGARFGTAVHAALEHTDYAAWNGAVDVPGTQRDLLIRCLRAQGLPEGGMRMDEALRQTSVCVGAALNATLPCGVRPCELASSARRAEMEFHLALAPVAAAKLFTLLHRHGYQQSRSGIGAETLHGLLTGVIDLVFEHDGKFHLIDWKTNWCPPWDGAALRTEITTHDYDLQWLIYTLALHRWLRQRIADYDYDRHVGEVYYLFVRGLSDGGGIHVDRPPRVLIETMDSLFTTHAERNT